MTLFEENDRWSTHPHLTSPFDTSLRAVRGAEWLLREKLLDYLTGLLSDVVARKILMVVECGSLDVSSEDDRLNWQAALAFASKLRNKVS